MTCTASQSASNRAGLSADRSTDRSAGRPAGRPRNLVASAATSCLLITGCGWVDSAGKSFQVPVTEVFLDDMPVGSTIVINEESRVHIVTSREIAASLEQTYAWSEEPLAQGALQSCVELSDFDGDLAASRLSEACTDASDCELSFEPIDNEDGVGEFDLLAPTLKAPVGLRHQLTVTDSDGRETISDYDFCLISINEAPVAVNDTFVVLEGRRETFSTDGVNLLSNDSDDIDDGNTEFRILPETVEGPEHAEFFALGEDGSFVYESSLTGILTDELDSFVYQLSDGVHVSTATATIRVVSLNQAPELIDDIPALEAVEGERFLENLGLYFMDPEQSELTYEMAASTPLPDDGNLSLSEEGVLSGVPDEDDVGTHLLTLIVGDGGATLEVPLQLIIEAAPIVPENSPPEYVEDTVFDQTILLGRSIRPVVPEFVDPDGDILEYSIVAGRSLPDGVEIDEDTGVISGRPTEVTNVRNLRVQATDPAGESAISDAFYIRVNRN